LLFLFAKFFLLPTKYTSKFTPDTSGTWKFGLGSIGATDLYINGRLVVNNSSNWGPGDLYFGCGSEERTGTIDNLEAGQIYDLEVRSWYQEDVRGSPFQTAGAFRFGAIPVIEDEKAIADAVMAAKNADVAIVVVGLNEDFESEGYDRKHMDLPGTTNKLIRAILEVNPNTVIVNQSGTPVTMPWVNHAHSLVQAFYGGNSLGDGLADVLFGKINPSSKLSLTSRRFSFGHWVWNHIGNSRKDVLYRKYLCRLPSFRQVGNTSTFPLRTRFVIHYLCLLGPQGL
jgi:beta-glucosidase